MMGMWIRAGIVALASGLMGCAGADKSGSAENASLAAGKPVATESKASKEALLRPALDNAGFESSKVSRDGRPEGWAIMQHAGPKSYEFGLDKEIYHGGSQALRIQNIGAEPYGLAQQDVPAQTLRGKTVALSAWLKTKATDGEGAGLVMRAMNGSAILSYNFMQAALVRGTQDWKAYSITLKIPDETVKFEIGVMLQGKGTVWADDFELAVLP